MSGILIGVIFAAIYEIVSWASHRMGLWAVGVCSLTWKYRHVIAYRAGRGESFTSIAKTYKISEQSINALLLGIANPNEEND